MCYNNSFFRVICLIISFALLPFALINSANAQTEVIIQASKDNTLYESDTGALSNGKGAHFFVGKTASGIIRRGLLAFDIAGNIESGASIESVLLTLNMSRTPTTTSKIITLHKLLSNWGEGNSNALGEEGAGAASMSEDATWIHTFFDSLFWTDNGGDFSDVVTATASIGGINSYTWNSTPELVADAQSWLDSPSANYGWILIGDENAVRTAKRFDSGENDIEPDRPLLKVIYTPAVGIQTNSNELPIRFDLKQNYPNPFNPKTKISYSLPFSGKVSLVVYNLLGEEVSRLVDDKQLHAGEYNTSWDASNMTSGIYFYRLTAGPPAGGFVRMRKMVLLK